MPHQVLIYLFKHQRMTAVVQPPSGGNDLQSRLRGLPPGVGEPLLPPLVRAGLQRGPRNAARLLLGGGSSAVLPLAELQDHKHAVGGVFVAQRKPQLLQRSHEFLEPLDLGCAALVRGGQQKGWRELPGQILYRGVGGHPAGEAGMSIHTDRQGCCCCYC